MTYKQVRDVIDLLRQAHQQVRKYLADAETADDPNTEKFLKALHHDAQTLQESLADYETFGDNGVLDTWMQYVPDGDVAEKLSGLRFTADMSPEEVVARKVEFDNAVAEMCDQLAAGGGTERVQELFAQIRDQMNSLSVHQVWSLREYQGGAQAATEDQTPRR